MTGREQNQPNATGAAAAAWVVRLQAPDAGEADWLAFEAWLRDTSGARGAYDAAMGLWLLADAYEADDLDEAPQWASPGRAVGRRRRGKTWLWPALGVGGLGAALAGVFVMTTTQGLPRSPTAPTATVYATAKGERRTVSLPDGTRLELSGASRLSVSLDPGARRVSLSAGEVAFAVTHDPKRPFTVTVGDQQVRDLGTEFDIHQDSSQIRITVRRGLVQVRSIDGGDAPTSLSAGLQLVHDEASHVSKVSAVSSDEAFAWTQGRLIYRDQPLRVVVDDLNRYFPHAVRIDGQRAAALRFTGVLTVDAEEATIRRLVALMPISATRVNGATVLKARDADD